jgi:hypothetical protein
MELVFGNGTQTTHDMMREHLDEKGMNVLAEADVIRVVVEDLKANPASTKYLMTELGWHKLKVKWGGVDYARAIWVRPGYHVEKGTVFGPGGFEEPLFGEKIAIQSKLENAKIWGLCEMPPASEADEGDLY